MQRPTACMTHQELRGDAPRETWGTWTGDVDVDIDVARGRGHGRTSGARRGESGGPHTGRRWVKVALACALDNPNPNPNPHVG